MKLFMATLLSLTMMFEGWTLFSKPKIVIEKNEVVQASGLKLPTPNSQLPTKEEAVTFDAMEEEELQLELLGTAIGNIKDPIAFIKDLAANRQGIYRLGSVIGEAKVTRITMGEVALDVNGKEQILRLSKRAMAWTGMNKRNSAIVSVSADKIVVSKNGLLNESGNIISAIRNIKVRPYYQAKEVTGMMVEGIPEDSIIALAGIHNKDIIKVVNNQKIDSYQKALQVFNKVRNQPEIKVSLLRDGQVKTLSYCIDK